MYLSHKIGFTLLLAIFQPYHSNRHPKWDSHCSCVENQTLSFSLTSQYFIHLATLMLHFIAEPLSSKCKYKLAGVCWCTRGYKSMKKLSSVIHLTQIPARTDPWTEIMATCRVKGTTLATNDSKMSFSLHIFITIYLCTYLRYFCLYDASVFRPLSQLLHVGQKVTSFRNFILHCRIQTLIIAQTFH